MKNHLRLAAAIGCLMVGATINAGQIALPTTLDKLLPVSDFAMVGGLKFSDFSYVWGGDMPAPSQIQVVSIGNTGIEFVGPFIDLPGGAGNGGSDARLIFTVTGGPISQVSLSSNPDLATATGNASITEDFLNVPNIKLSVFDKPNDGVFKSFDSASLGGAYGSVVVRKDIMLLTQAPDVNATISSIRQEFTPEPAGFTLALLGMLGFVLRRKR